MEIVNFNIPFVCKESIDNVKNLIEQPANINKGVYLNKCKSWFENYYIDYTAFMTTSCTRALEMIALSIDLKIGDEIILSPYTYVGVANAFANYGAKLVFVDIDAQTMNIDAKLIEVAITNKTKAIIAMHYAGIACDMDKIVSICDRNNLILIEDNAQGIQSYSNNKALGSYGDFSCISFDMLKNISCNEGGVLLCKQKWKDKVDIVYNNGTNKTAFSLGLVNSYEWVSKGSKFAMSEYTAAVLHPMLEKSSDIINERIKIWKTLYNKIYEVEGLRKLIPKILLDTPHTAHLAYLKFENKEQRDSVLQFMNKNGVPCSFHYIPLDISKEGKNNTNNINVCEISLHESDCLLRLPMHNFLSNQNIEKIVEVLKTFFKD